MHSRRLRRAVLVGISLVIPDGVVQIDRLTGEDVVRTRTELDPRMLARLQAVAS